MSETTTPAATSHGQVASLFTNAPEPISPVRQVIRTINGASEATAAVEVVGGRETVPSTSAYPHLYDLTMPAGKAMQHVSQALADAQKALEAYGEGDLEAVQSELGLVAAQLAAAHPLVDFSRDFASVLAFIRRASIAASAADVDREMLNALVAAVRKLLETPTISLMDAAMLTQKLEEHGWRGTHRAVEELLRALLDEPDRAQVAQTDMFGLLTVESVRAKS